MRFFKIFIGNLLISFTYACITVPKIILNGGVTSFSLIMEHLTGLSVSNMVNLMTALLLLLSLIFLGRSYFVGVLFSSVCYVVTFNGIYYFDYEVPVNFYLAIPIAAFLIAGGYYFCISAKSSAVSFDTIALILNHKNSFFDVAVTMSVINALVLLMGLLVFSPKAVLAGLVFTFLQGVFLKIFLKKVDKRGYR